MIYLYLLSTLPKGLDKSVRWVYDEYVGVRIIKISNKNMNTKIKIDIDNLIAYNNDRTFFITNKLADGCLIGFYNHSIDGVRKRKRGWVIIDSINNKIIDSINTYRKNRCYLGFIKWFRAATKSHGRILNTIDNRWVPC